jgi:hypothetical protein
MHDLGRREAVEERAAGSAIGAHVFGVDEFAELHVRQLLGQADSVEGVAGEVGPKTEQSCVGPSLKLFRWY